MDEERKYRGEEPDQLPDPELALTSGTRDRSRMGSMRRRMGLAAALVGLMTFFLPLVSTDTKVLGRTLWSPLQILIGLYAHQLPVQPVPSPKVFALFMGEYLVFGLGTVYVILILITAVLLISPSARFVGYAAALGAGWTAWSIWWGYRGLQYMIYGAPSAFASGHHVQGGVNGLILLTTLGALVYVAAAKELN